MHRGFTLIELLVVVAIIVIVSASILANGRKYGGEIQLQNLAYDMALSIRQAQVYGISVRLSGASYTSGYGIYVNAVSSPTLYRLYSDSGTVNGQYDSGEDVSPSPYNINGGFKVAEVCVPAGTDSATCAPLNGGILNLVFIRPEPNAWINAPCSLTVGNEKCSGGAASARIVLSSPRGDIMSIIIYANGEISVSKT